MPGVGVKVLPIPFIALRRPQLLPARRFVTGGAKALRIDEGFRHLHRVTKVFRPIRRQPLANELQNPRGQIGPLARGGQHQKPGILRDQMPPLFDLARRPAQPLISKLEVKRRRTEDHQGQPLASILGDIPQHAADRSRVLQVVLGR